MKHSIILLLAVLPLVACNGKGIESDNAVRTDDTVATEAGAPKTQTLIIDVEPLKPPEKALATKSYNQTARSSASPCGPASSASDKTRRPSPSVPRQAGSSPVSIDAP